MKAHHPRESETVMSELMMPQHANIMGNVFGGVVLSLVDRIAAVCAIRHAQKQCVTVSVDKVDFREPIHVGELVSFLASVNYTGTTSMEVGIKVVTENIQRQSVRHANSCFFTMVAVDDERKPVSVPPLVPATPDQQRRHDAAKVRRQLRQEFDARIRATRQGS